MVRTIAIATALRVVVGQDFLQPLNASRGCHGGSMNSCLDHCIQGGGSSSHHSCEQDGATSCLTSKCCQNSGDKCYTKNPYWAACKQSCTPGEHDSYDNDPWECKELKPHASPLIKCIKKCQHHNDDIKSCVGACLYASKPGHGTCEKDGSSDCSTSKCCQNPGERCYTKNKYWAACKASCTPGEHDDYDKDRWECHEVDGSGGGKLGKCLSTCKSDCPNGPSPPPAPTPSSWNQCRGSLSYTEEGKTKKAYLMVGPMDSTRGEGVHAHGHSVTIDHGPRLYFAEHCQQSIAPDMFLKKKLIGKSLEYTVDMSRVGCGCNAAFYMVTMPAGGRTQCNDYYCDANAVCGSNCAELDLQEGNSHSWATTPHHAYDSKGCEKHAHNYGPGKTIDPAHGPIHIKVSFHGHGSRLSKMTTKMSQGSKSIVITHDGSCGESLAEVARDLASTGMVFTMSNWGGDHKTMDWLDGDVCGKESCNRGSFTVSDIVISTRRRRSHNLQASNVLEDEDLDDEDLEVEEEIV